MIDVSIRWSCEYDEGGITSEPTSADGQLRELSARLFGLKWGWKICGWKEDTCTASRARSLRTICKQRSKPTGWGGQLLKGRFHWRTGNICYRNTAYDKRKFVWSDFGFLRKIGATWGLFLAPPPLPKVFFSQFFFPWWDWQRNWVCKTGKHLKITRTIYRADNLSAMTTHANNANSEYKRYVRKLFCIVFVEASC